MRDPQEGIVCNDFLKDSLFHPLSKLHATCKEGFAVHTKLCNYSKNKMSQGACGIYTDNIYARAFIDKYFESFPMEIISIISQKNPPPNFQFD
jgi:hypothetical protein